HLFGTTLLTLLPVLFARLTECGLFLLTAIYPMSNSWSFSAALWKNRQTYHPTIIAKVLVFYVTF
ncbi:hypothetical protein ONQ60_27145, partial [Salmonella enterica subsp. enterica serovar Virginia]|nr:hypothetical protein [Salmonella enterica subsp. enterica serovar Virginia]